jgi:hypothetical protein
LGTHRKLGKEPTLADAGLSYKEYKVASASPSFLQALQQPKDLLFAAYEAGARNAQMA